MTDSIDLNRELIRIRPPPSMPVLTEYSMKDCGIDDGDLLVIDKSLDPLDGDIVVAYIDGEFTLKTVRFAKKKIVSGLFRPMRNIHP